MFRFTLAVVFLAGILSGCGGHMKTGVPDSEIHKALANVDSIGERLGLPEGDALHCLKFNPASNIQSVGQYNFHIYLVKNICNEKINFISYTSSDHWANSRKIEENKYVLPLSPNGVDSLPYPIHAMNKVFPCANYHPMKNREVSCTHQKVANWEDNRPGKVLVERSTPFGEGLANVTTLSAAVATPIIQQRAVMLQQQRQQEAARQQQLTHLRRQQAKQKSRMRQRQQENRRREEARKRQQQARTRTTWRPKQALNANSAHCLKKKRLKGGFNVADNEITNTCSYTIEVHGVCLGDFPFKANYPFKGAYSSPGAWGKTLRPNRWEPDPNMDICHNRGRSSLYIACKAPFTPHFLSANGSTYGCFKW